MKLDKKVFFRIHSWIGIKLSILFFIVCFSGTLATLSHEMDWLFIPEMRANPSGSLASRNLIVRNLQNEFPGARMQYWMASEDSYLCDIVYMIDGEQLHYTFVNPYTGAVQGSAHITFQRFFRDLHYYLFIPFQVGHFTVLFFGFLLFVSMVTALLFYKKWYRKLFELKVGKSPLVFFRSLHRLVGLWSVPLSIVFSITGIWYFIERANVADVGTIANPASPKLEHRPDADQPNDGFEFSLDYDRAVRVAVDAIPGLVVKDILPPKGPAQTIYLNGKDNTPLVRNRANRVYIDPLTYEVVKVQKAKELNTVTWINDIADPIHFGYWGGLATKVIWFVFGLGISSLVLTGMWMSQKRKVKSATKRNAQKMGIWKYLNWLVTAVMFGFLYYALLARYHASSAAVLAITLGFAGFIWVGWYIFNYKLKKVVEDELKYEFHA